MEFDDFINFKLVFPLSHAVQFSISRKHNGENSIFHGHGMKGNHSNLIRKRKQIETQTEIWRGIETI